MKIKLDSPFAQDLGFTTDKFDGWLWLRGKYIYISFIMSKQAGKGNLSKLFDKVLSFGYGIKVPTPFTDMQSILMKKGFNQTVEYSRKMGSVPVWVKDPLVEHNEKG